MILGIRIYIVNIGIIKYVSKNPINLLGRSDVYSIPGECSLAYISQKRGSCRKDATQMEVY